MSLKKFSDSHWSIKLTLSLGGAYATAQVVFGLFSPAVWFICLVVISVTWISNSFTSVDSDKTDYSVFVFFSMIALSSLFLSFSNAPRVNDLEEIEIACDRINDEGCSFRVDTEYGEDKVYEVYSAIDQETRMLSFYPVMIISGDRSWTTSVMDGSNAFDYQYKDAAVQLNLEAPFPFIEKDSLKGYGQYRLMLWNDSLYIKGDILDLESSEVVGWLNRGEFGVKKRCSLSKNKDAKGFEVVDKYGHVIFSIDFKKSSFKESLFIKDGDIVKGQMVLFKGFFKTDDSFIIVDTGVTYVTSDIKEARQHLSNIDPIFEHRSNSPNWGERIVY